MVCTFNFAGNAYPVIDIEHKLLMTDQKIIAVGGFQHETNTFAPHLAPFEAFERADSWPGLTVGDSIAGVMAGLNLPLSGFIDAATQADDAVLDDRTFFYDASVGDERTAHCGVVNS